MIVDWKSRNYFYHDATNAERKTLKPRHCRYRSTSNSGWYLEKKQSGKWVKERTAVQDGCQCIVVIGVAMVEKGDSNSDIRIGVPYFTPALMLEEVYTDLVVPG